MDKLRALSISLGLNQPSGEELELLEYLLETSADIIMTRRRPYEASPPFEERYGLLQIRVATELYNKRGAEGQTTHSESGVSRTYESAGVSEALLREIVPVCKVLR